MKSLTIFIAVVHLLTICASLQALAAQEKTGQQPMKDDPLPPPKVDIVPGVPASAPDDRGKVLGTFLKPAANEAGLLLASPMEKRHWLQLTPNQPVKSGQTYMALPGFRGELQLGGVKLSLVGLLPEVVPFPVLLESMVDLHQHEALAVDLTLQRGRIVLTSEAENPIVRVRFENPGHPEQGEFIDLTLHGKGTQVLIDRGGVFRRGKAFFEDPKNPGREPPGAFVGIWVLQGGADVRHDSVRHALPAKSMLLWNTLKGLKTPEAFDKLPPMIAVDPSPPDEPDMDRQKLRDDIFKARDELAREPAGKPIKIRLAVACQSSNVARRMMAIRCYAALGALPELVECLIDERDTRSWLAVVAAAKHWMAASRDNEYLVLDALRQRFTKGEAVKITELLHGLAKPDALVEFLDNPCLTIRQLAHLNLCEMVPKGRAIRYDPTRAAEQRQAAQQEWHKLLQMPEKK